MSAPRATSVFVGFRFPREVISLAVRWYLRYGLKVADKRTCHYRAVDQYGQVIDVLLSTRRDLAAARRFFIRALRAGTIPAEVTTGRAPVYPRGGPGTCRTPSSPASRRN